MVREVVLVSPVRTAIGDFGGSLEDVPPSALASMARTDAAAAEGLDAAIEHAVAYVEAGADMIFPEAMQSLDDYRRSKAAVKVPILANLTEFGSTPFFTTSELRDANVDIALYCCGAYRAMNAAALNFYETTMRDGTKKAAVPTMQTRADLYRYLGYHAYEDKLDALFAARKWTKLGWIEELNQTRRKTR